MKINLKIIISLITLLMPFSNYALATKSEKELCNSLTTSDLLECTHITYNVLDDRLNKTYNQLRNMLDDDVFVELQNVQRMWLKQFKNICDIEYPDKTLGSELPVYYSLCLNSQLSERNRELDIIYEYINNINRYYKINDSVIKNKVFDQKWKKYNEFHCIFMNKYFMDKECLIRNKYLHETNFG